LLLKNIIESKTFFIDIKNPISESLRKIIILIYESINEKNIKERN